MLVYPEPSRSEPQADAPAGDSAGRGITVGLVFAVLRQRAPWILALAVVLAVAGLITSKMLTPRYTAEAQLYIDPRDLRLVDKELTPGNQDSVGLLAIVESQAQVILSRSVLRRVVTRLDLTHDPEFSPAAAPGLLSWFGLGSDAKEPDDPNRTTAVVLDALRKRVSVSRSGRTFIVDVGVWSRDGDQAARLANALTEAYLAEDAANRASAASSASAELTGQLGELRNAVKAAEDRVQAYRIDHNLVGTRDQLVTDQQLTTLNAQLASARVRAADAQARYGQVQAVQQSGLDVGASAAALSSPTISALRGQYADLTRRQAELQHDLGPRHPQVTAIAPQVQQTKRLIDQEVARYVLATRNELASAQATVTALERSFDEAQKRTLRLDAASIRLRELEGEVEASRSIYQAFYIRARETGQQARLNIGNARIITQANVPLARSFPPPARTLGLLGFGLGLALGCALAFAAYQLRRGMSGPRTVPEAIPPRTHRSRTRPPSSARSPSPEVLRERPL